jgi:hypothetical protein
VTLRKAARPVDVFTAYYLLTPLFWLLDVAVEAPLRAAAIAPGGARRAYYLALLATGVVCWLRPRWAPFLALIEGSGTLLLLVLAILLPVWDLAAGLEAGGPVIALPQVANFAIVASMTVFSIKRAEWALFHR